MNNGNCIPEKSPPARRNKKPRRVTESWLHNSGLYYLQRFSASTEQFRKVMKRKIERSCHAHPDQDRKNSFEMLEKLIQTFCRSGLLNDAVYAEGLLSSLQRRGLSSRTIRQRMKEKGLDQEVIDKLFQERVSNDEHGDLKAALRLAQRRRIGPYRKKAYSEDVYKKEIAILARAGFDYQTAKRVLSFDDDGSSEEVIADPGDLI